MHEHFYVIQLLIEADVIEVPPPPPPKNVEQVIYEYVDCEKGLYFLR